MSGEQYLLWRMREGGTWGRATKEIGRRRGWSRSSHGVSRMLENFLTWKEDEWRRRLKGFEFGNGEIRVRVKGKWREESYTFHRSFRGGLERKGWKDSSRTARDGRKQKQSRWQKWSVELVKRSDELVKLFTYC